MATATRERRVVGVPTRAAPTGETLAGAVRTGVIGGLVGAFISTIGIVERFSESQIITGIITLGPAVLYISMALSGYMAARDRTEEGERVILSSAQRLISGLIAGAAFGAIMAGYVVLFNAVNLRDVFPNLSPILLGEILTFGEEPGTGALLLFGAAAGLGLLGAAFRFLRSQDRRVLMTGILAVTLVGVLEQLIRVMLSNLELEYQWLYTGGGLSVSGAVIVFVAAAAFALLGTRRERLYERVAARQEQREDGAADGGRRENVAMGVGLGSAGFCAVLAVAALVTPGDDLPYNPSLLVVALLVGFVAVGVTTVVARSRTGPRRMGRAGIGLFAAVAGIFAIVPLLVGVFLSQTMVTVMVYVLLGLGLNIVVGYAGLLDLGYVAFFAVGAYSIALLTSLQSSLVAEGVGEFGSGSQQAAAAGWTNFWIALPLTVVVAVVIGILIGAPVLRLRGDYLAIVTLGFGEIVRVIVRSDWAGPILGGSQGIKLIPAIPPASLEFDNPQNLYYIIFIFCLLAAYVSWRLQFSRTGRAWAAMREDEDVAEAMGVSVIKYKLLAFAMGAAVGCFSGAFFATNLSVITPDSFELLVSITVLAAIILGGMGNIAGVIVGAAFLVGVPELLREFVEFRSLVYGAILVGIMILRPEGLIPSVQRRRELHEREAEEVQFEKRVGGESPAPVMTAGAAGGTEAKGPERTP